MNIRLSKQISIQCLVMGLSSLLFGIFLSWPLQVDWAAMAENLSPLLNSWWRILFLSLAAIVLANVFLRIGNIALAEYAATMASFSLLYPLLAFLTALPSEPGIKGLFFILGGFTIIISLSAIIALQTKKRLYRIEN